MTSLPFFTCRSLLLLFMLLLGVANGASLQAAEDRTQVELATTKGVIVLDLYPDQAPETVANFLRLVDSGFYDGLSFHRVVPGFMIQTGGYDAKLNLHEAPRQVPNESFNSLSNFRGSVAMARLDDPDSAGSQFFINVRNNPHLNSRPGKPGYTVFGRVLSGMEVVNEIELTPTTNRNGLANVPVEPVLITRAKRL
jgi:peptidyl-prolyl cis-trans isomerase A (cyclophilin A)